MYIDESGIDKFLCRPFGRSFFGEVIQGMISGKRYQRESFVAGKIGSKIIAPFCYQGDMKRKEAKTVRRKEIIGH